MNKILLTLLLFYSISCADLRDAHKLYKNKEYNKAFQIYLQYAEKGHKNAQGSVGKLYRLGYGIQQDFKKSAFWYKKAANQGNPSAQYIIGSYYIDGTGVEKDLKKAKLWLTMAESISRTERLKNKIKKQLNRIKDIELDFNAFKSTNINNKPKKTIITSKHKVNGSFIWNNHHKINEISKKYNFNNYIWIPVYKNKYSKKSKHTNWARSSEYCKNLQIIIDDYTINDFTLPSQKDLKTLFKRRKYFPSSHNDLWSNVGANIKGYRDYMVKFYALDEGRYHGWYGSNVRRKSTTSSSVVCVSKKQYNIDYIGLIDPRNVTNSTIEQLVYKMYTSQINKLKKPPKRDKPKLTKYQKLEKDEFETSQQFNKRVNAHEASIDSENEEKLNSWKKSNEKLTRKAKEELEILKSNPSKSYIRFYKNAFSLKYGNPKIKSVNYNADKQLFEIVLTSTKGKYTKKVKQSVKLKYARKFKEILTQKNFNPTINYSIQNDKLVFNSIEEIKDPEYLVEEKEFKTAMKIKDYNEEGKIQALETFISKYPNSTFISSSKEKIEYLILKIEQEKERQRVAKMRREKESIKRQAEYEARKERKNNSYSTQKTVGDKVCKDGTTALILSITMTAYVERVNGNNIQLRISDTEGTNPYYKGVTLYRDTLIWDNYTDWYMCNY